MRATFVLVILTLRFVSAITAQPNHASDDRHSRNGHRLHRRLLPERCCPHGAIAASSLPETHDQWIQRRSDDYRQERIGKMVQEVRDKKEVTPASKRKKEISIFAIDGDVASCQAGRHRMDKLHYAFEAERRVEDSLRC